MMSTMARQTPIQLDSASPRVRARTPCCLLQVVRAALLQGSVEQDEVYAIDMHGTGTPLGDPIEVGALASVLQVSGAAT